MIMFVILYLIIVLLCYFIHVLMLRMWNNKLTEAQKYFGNRNAIIFSFFWVFFVKHNLKNIIAIKDTIKIYFKQKNK